jgi:4-hydroxy-tetrahydrodipicolinate synthase
VPELTLRGILPALVTPFREDERIDYAAWQVIVDTMIAAGLDGLFVGGPQGEFCALDFDERRVSIRFCLQASAGRVPVYANVGCVTTADTVLLAQHAAAMGADAIVAVTPYYLKPTQDELVEHYTEVCRAVQVPVLTYNFPQHGGVEILPESLARIAARCENLAGIQDSGGSLERAAAYRTCLPEREMAVFVGAEHLILPALEAGCAGCVSAWVTVAPRLFVELYRAFRQGRKEDAARLHTVAAGMSEWQALHTFPSPVKEALRMIGLGAGPCRKPVGPMPPEAREKLAAAVGKLGQEGWLAHAYEPAGEREKSVPAPARS